MLTPIDIKRLRHAVQFRQQPIEGEAVTITLMGGPLDGIGVAVGSHQAGHPMIGWATVTDAGCVLAEYEGDPAEATRSFRRYFAPGGNMKPGAAHQHRR